MTEFMYKLNLPPLDEILTDEGKSQLLVGKDEVIYEQYHPAGLVKPEWLMWEGIEWNFINFFYKPEHRGMIHSDGSAVWGINWIYQGWGAMEYWHLEDVSALPAEYDELGSQRSECIPLRPPCKVYGTAPGAYLTNATPPHRASGRNGRYAFSLRCYSSTWIPWDEAVIKFKHLMI